MKKLQSPSSLRGVKRRGNLFLGLVLLFSLFFNTSVVLAEDWSVTNTSPKITQAEIDAVAPTGSATGPDYDPIVTDSSDFKPGKSQSDSNAKDAAQKLKEEGFRPRNFNATGPAEKDEIKLMAPFDSSKDKIKTSGGAISILEQWVGQVYMFGAGLTSIIAVFWIVVGGYEIMIKGAGSSADIASGKDKITQALLGLTLVFLSALILHTVNPEFFIL